MFVCMQINLCQRAAEITMEYIDGTDVDKTLDANLAAQLLFSGCFLFSSWWVFDNYYAGFVALFTAAIFIVFPCVSWYLLRR